MNNQFDTRIRAFLKDWNDWRLNGALDEHPTFKRHLALCYTLSIWEDPANRYFVTKTPMTMALTDMFVADQLDSVIPFNESYDQLGLEAANRMIHLNKQRIQWVERRLLTSI